MIVLNLCCENEHLFEGWFASAEAFESQSESGLVACPLCGSLSISRRPTAPYVNTGAPADISTRTPEDAKKPSPEAIASVLAMLRRAGKESEDVGERFAEEARGIHYGDREARSIKGKASRDDIGDLISEGIMVLPLPPDEGDLH